MVDSVIDITTLPALNGSNPDRLDYRIKGVVSDSGRTAPWTGQDTITGDADDPVEWRLVDSTIDNDPDNWSDTKLIGVIAPVITGVPTIDNTTPTEGDVLTATPASVTGSPTPTRTWQWFSAGSPVGTNSATYTTGTGDVGNAITVRQTETNGGGSDNATSAATSPVQAGTGETTDVTITTAPNPVVVTLNGTPTTGRYPVGAAGDGDLYVVGATTISAYTPAFGDHPTETRKINGAWLNPQARPGNSDQPYDELVTTNPAQSCPYNATLGAVTPISMTPGDVLVIAVSRLDATVGDVQAFGAIDQFIVINCVASAPGVTELRPPYMNPANDPATPKPTYTLTEADMDRLPKRTISEPVPSTLLADLQAATLYDWVVDWADYNMEMAYPGTTYGRDYMERVSDALTFLASDATNAAKLPIAQEIAQRGIDHYAAFKSARQQGNTKIWEANGYHNQGRKCMIVIAGHILNDTDMMNVVQETTLNGQACFQEDGQYVYMTKSQIDLTVGQTLDGNNSAYPQEMVDVPEWVGQDGDNFALGQAHYIWSGSSYYRSGNITSMYGAVFYLLSAKLTVEWGRSSFFAYARRQFDIEKTGVDQYTVAGNHTDAGFTPMLLLPAGATPSGYTGVAMDEHITELQPYPWEMSVITVLGQSENMIGWTFNNTASTTHGPYPDVLSGVDAQISIPYYGYDGATEATVAPINPTTAAAKDISPGAVAIANLWHTATGGKALRFLSNNKSGTGFTDMMKDSLTVRDIADDIDVIEVGQREWNLPVRNALYQWYVSEAGAAKDLWGNRSTHFTGLGPDYLPSNFETYENNASEVNHCLIDTTDRGYGILEYNTRVSVMLPGNYIDATDNDLLDPPKVNYTTDPDGSQGAARTIQNGPDAYQNRSDFVTSLLPEDQRGRAATGPNLVQMGDYVGGVQEPNGQVTSHPALKSKYGQILYSQDVAFGMLCSFGYAERTTLKRTEIDSAGAFVDFVFDLPDTAILSTHRIVDGLTVASPRPHQQEVMGFTISRIANSDTDRTLRAAYRTDQTDDTLYPPEYRASVVIHDTGSGGAGAKEGVVRVTPVQAFEDGDIVQFGMDGAYGAFILSGYPDYDAHMWLDGLRAYDSTLDDGTIYKYPGGAVVNQEEVVISGVSPTPPPTSLFDFDAVDASEMTSNFRVTPSDSPQKHTLTCQAISSSTAYASYDISSVMTGVATDYTVTFEVWSDEAGQEAKAAAGTTGAINTVTGTQKVLSTDSNNPTTLTVSFNPNTGLSYHAGIQPRITSGTSKIYINAVDCTLVPP